MTWLLLCAYAAYGYVQNLHLLIFFENITKLMFSMCMYTEYLCAQSREISHRKEFQRFSCINIHLSWKNNICHELCVVYSVCIVYEGRILLYTSNPPR